MAVIDDCLAAAHVNHRELSFDEWLVCRAAELPRFRKMFHTDYFAEGDLEEKRSKIEQLVASGPRVLQSDMAEVRGMSSTISVTEASCIALALVKNPQGFSTKTTLEINESSR